MKLDSNLEGISPFELEKRIRMTNDIFWSVYDDIKKLNQDNSSWFLIVDKIESEVKNRARFIVNIDMAIYWAVDYNCNIKNEVG